MNEEWKLIDELLSPDNRFYISSWGRLWDNKLRRYASAYLHKSNGASYPRVSIGHKRHMVHRLVALHFKHIPARVPEDAKLVVKHIDGNTLNPNENNLEWDIQSNNIKEAFRFNAPPILPGVLT